MTASTATATTYEYLTVRVDRDREDLSTDTYRSLGWTIEDREDPLAADTPRPLASRFARDVPLVGRLYRAAEDATPQANTITLRLKRDRHLPNRAQVAELQRIAEASLAGIDRLERTRAGRANAASLGLGALGAGFLACSVFSLLGGLSVLMVVLGATGLFAWIGAFLANTAVKRNRTARIAPLLDEHYATIYSAGEQAARLLLP